MKRVAVVGGGITGLAACLRLLSADKGIRVHLYEAAERLGGHVQTIRQPDLGITVEAGPDSMLARKPAAMRLVESLGMANDVVSTRPEAKETFIVRGGALCPMPRGYLGIPFDASCAKPPLLSPAGIERVLQEERLPAELPEGDVPLGAFLRSRLGDEWVDYVGEPLLAGIYAGHIDRLSLSATWPSLVDLVRAHGSLVAASRALAAPRQPGPSRSAFVTVRGGLSSVIERMAERIQASDRAEIRTGSRVYGMETRGPRYRLKLESTSGERFEEDVDGAVIAIPPHAARELLLPILDLPNVDTHFQSTATIVLVYPRTAFGPDLDRASGFLVPRPEGMAVTATTWMSSKWPHVAPESLAVIRAYIGRRGQDEALALSDDELARRAAEEVGRLTGAREQPVWVRVTRFAEAMPNYGVGHLARVAQVELALRSSLPAIAVAGAGYRGVGLPDCVEQGERAAEQVISAIRG
ncbi:protoporphyrinogen oxidase [Alicyclobacillus fructus]|uniref:protoporphyrinogen oxidase n=1 Tax=Alicyclobacillus fructus TaxID=2816082 RepID=UPI001A8F21E1|nr:protoporphyrinogen oxidase [Alicyclobacillus fructus]